MQIKVNIDDLSIDDFVFRMNQLEEHKVNKVDSVMNGIRNAVKSANILAGGVGENVGGLAAVAIGGAAIGLSLAEVAEIVQTFRRNGHGELKDNGTLTVKEWRKPE